LRASARRWKKGAAPARPGSNPINSSTRKAWRPNCGTAAIRTRWPSFLYGKLSKETQQVVDSNADEDALRRALSKDLNIILEGTNMYSANGSRTSSCRR
jgi:hypothetical protein